MVENKIIDTICSVGNVDVLKLLINHYGINIVHKPIDDNSNYPIMIAVSNNHIDMVRFLIDECKVDINIRNNDGYAPLHFACKHGNVEMVKFLIDRGADVNMAAYDDTAPIHSSLMSPNYREIIRLLLERGANIPSYKRDPIVLAVYNNKVDIIDDLIENGSNINCSDEKIMGETISHILCRSYSVKDIISIFTKYKDIINVNIKDKYGHTPLFCICNRYFNRITDKIYIIIFMIKILGADPNVKDNYNRTPISYISTFGYDKVELNRLLRLKNSPISYAYVSYDNRVLNDTSGTKM